MAMSDRVARVLAGAASYDDLDGRAQAAVRRAWDEQIAEDISRLDLPERFAGRWTAVGGSRR